MQTKILAVIIVIFATFLTSSAQIFYKLGVNNLAFSFSGILNFHLMMGIFLYAVAAVLAILAFRQGEVSILYPVFATSYIWVSLLASYFFGEVINIFTWIGILIIIIGVALIGLHGTASYDLKEVI